MVPLSNVNWETGALQEELAGGQEGRKVFFWRFLFTYVSLLHISMRIPIPFWGLFLFSTEIPWMLCGQSLRKRVALNDVEVDKSGEKLLDILQTTLHCSLLCRLPTSGCCSLGDYGRGLDDGFFRSHSGGCFSLRGCATNGDGSCPLPLTQVSVDVITSVCLILYKLSESTLWWSTTWWIFSIFKHFSRIFKRNWWYLVVIKKSKGYVIKCIY